MQRVDYIDGTCVPLANSGRDKVTGEELHVFVVPSVQRSVLTFNTCKTYKHRKQTGV